MHQSPALVCIQRKVTLLCWARQIGASEESRQAQGHHRQSGVGQNVALYGRDDVHPAIQLQYQIIQRVAAGFRPVIPLPRGGAKPMIDGPVVVPPVAEDVAPLPEAALNLPDGEDLVGSECEGSDPGAPADETQDETYVPVVQAKSTDCVFLLNVSSSVAHVVACCLNSDPCCVVTLDDGQVSKSFKFACNLRRSAWDSEIVPAETFPAKFRLSMRPAGAKIFD